MEKIVIHSTKYGSTEKYAMRIAKQIHSPVVKGDKVAVEDLKDYDIIILGSCLLEGKLANSSLYQQWISAYPDKHWLIFTVGLSNPKLTDFQKILAAEFDEVTCQRVSFYHYRGTIQYKRMQLMGNLANRAVMHRKDSIDTVKLGEEDKALLQKYGTHYDLSDENKISYLIEEVQQIEAEVMEQS
ncbi:hypothetical protein I4Q36_09095 [Tuanshanicoccus lijuaniae]|uniref:flavodoxin domain-containing protein n=1 Tax=Aerococcaceae bacterium zg-1292 TaxID=2774330 RepID=UPI0019356794|nr:hypothetical protein [Aerococcaceae bacterium zg-1292]MBF6626618.1 hypothetical protein [Aerococcaceae bacterium zg-BR9]MBF6978984.1 hypothetical protein [Aerococcaceae bacterium zg-BR22]MBS4455420.1 hypothetical protein [Aerococcaceae bacterium zg-A91]MBS4457380.1 hypothetical protein [Aerococcaceae bacterium zg-BR33]